MVDVPRRRSARRDMGFGEPEEQPEDAPLVQDRYVESHDVAHDWLPEEQEYPRDASVPASRRELPRGETEGERRAPRRRGSGWRVAGAVLGSVLLLVAVVVGSYYAGAQLGTTEEDPREVAIPAVRGQSISDVNNVLQQLGLSTVFTAPVYDEQIPLNSVVSTSPPAQTTLRTGDVVTITYSSGPQPITVPPVVGQPEEAAKTALTENGLNPGFRVEQPSTDVPAGAVTRLEPGVGTQVPPGLQITMVVSTGPPPVVLPRVIGLTEQEATAQLNGQTIQVEVDRRFSSRVEENRVIDQVPAAGTVAPPGSTVILTVSLGP